MNQIEQTFIDNIEIAIDQLNKGIIDTFKSSVIPLPFVCDYLSDKHNYTIHRSHVDPEYTFVFILKNNKKQMNILGNFVHGPITIKYKDEN